ncbi:MAG: DUF5615 family PIN-like protein [Proteobacteria bacterium]|nr:DUF5615 family PIN-like protein [Pseudomonadota bacterium]
MKVLADENCGQTFKRVLMAAGHDVQLIRDIARGLDDEAVFDLAREQGRILLTHDRDFGGIAEQAATRPPAVVLMRLRTLSPDSCAALVAKTLADLGETLVGHFVVIEPMGVRIRRYKD